MGAATFYATVRSDEAIVKLAQLSDLTDLKRWPLGLPVAVAERVHAIHALAESVLADMELIEEKEVLEPERVAVKIGGLTIESDGPAVCGSKVQIDGKDVLGLKGIVLSAHVDEGVWRLSLDLIPGMGYACRKASEAANDSGGHDGRE